jgi:putative transposase
MIEPGHPISIRRQCGLSGISRSGFYYKPAEVSEEDLKTMRMIDEQYTRTPFYGVEKMTAHLHREGSGIGHNKVRVLMRTTGPETIYPKPRLSIPSSEQKIYPYLLKNIEIERPNQVWSTDITYIRLSKGFIYLTAVMDWFSRYVISWKLSISPDAEFCVNALKEALRRGKPEIFNSDQGSQFTSSEFTGVLKTAGVRISMDGRGRVFDNIFVERLWRSVKYEEVYIRDYGGVSEARCHPENYFRFYNTERLHQTLNYQTPEEVHFSAEYKFVPD